MISAQKRKVIIVYGELPVVVMQKKTKTKVAEKFRPGPCTKPWEGEGSS